MAAPNPDNHPTSSRRGVFIVDDHPVFRDGLIQVVEKIPDLFVCGHSANATQASNGINQTNPDLVLLDIGLPGKSGLDLLHDLNSTNPHLPVLVISMHEESLYAERVLKAGGRGYIMKQEGPEQITDAILKVLDGQIYLSHQASSAVLQALAKPRGSAGSTTAQGKLTERELEVLRLTGEGKNNHDIARELHISVKTVDTHRTHIREKLSLKNGTELVHYAVRWIIGGQP